MPTTRRKHLLPHRCAEYATNEALLCRLATGVYWAWLDDAGTFAVDGDIPQSVLREAWRELGGALLYSQVFGEGWTGAPITTNRPPPAPGYRPWAWWQFTAPAPRLRIDGQPSDVRYVERGLEHAYESDPDYLQRYDLFLPGEKPLLQPHGV